MESNKFENQLREQLQSREIRPSEEAWDRISQQLEASEKSRPVRRQTGPTRFQWYGIAAGFIGTLFVSVLYFTLNDPSGVPEIEITDVNKDSPPPNTSPVIIQKEKFPDEDALVDTKGREEKNRESTPQRHPDTFTENALARSRGVETAPKKVTIPRNPSEEIIHEKIAEIVAQVEVLEKENSTVTDAEIDSLLRNAQRQILEDKMFRKDRSVDAMALLADVEDELDRSFRDEIFDALKDGFLKVRTAVADRNR